MEEREFYGTTDLDAAEAFALAQGREDILDEIDAERARRARAEEEEAEEAGL